MFDIVCLSVCQSEYYDHHNDYDDDGQLCIQYNVRQSSTNSVSSCKMVVLVCAFDNQVIIISFCFLCFVCLITCHLNIVHTHIWVIHIQDSNLIAVADKKTNYAAKDDGTGKKTRNMSAREREREKFV